MGPNMSVEQITRHCHYIKYNNIAIDIGTNTETEMDIKIIVLQSICVFFCLIYQKNSCTTLNLKRRFQLYFIFTIAPFPTYISGQMTLPVKLWSRYRLMARSAECALAGLR